jgi:putative nucleotidyltransferase with HDIG domain
MELTRDESEPRGVAAFVTATACAASVMLALSAAGFVHAVGARPGTFAVLLALTVALQLVVVDAYGRGTLSFASTGSVAIAMTFGIGAAAAVGVLHGAVLLARTRSPLHRGIFNAANFALASGAAGIAFQVCGGDVHHETLEQVLPAVAAGAAYGAVNVSLLTAAMSLSEGLRPLTVWQERFRWLTPHSIASGPLALALVLAYTKVGLAGMFAFVVPPAMMMLSIRQYVSRTRRSVEEVRRANDELRRANAALEERNDDLRALYEFAAGLSAQTHDRDRLVRYAEQALQQLTGSPARVSGDTVLAEGERWNRLRDAVLPQLATALESASLVERVRKTHLETIAALSRSMEAKDYYTGGHTERVADVAVALARRLGYEGHDLDAIEIGALLHDIGKIGIPERILHKPGPLDDDEWRVMKEHPLISEYILAEVDLDPIVCQIARSSHERMDGAGYPDGLGGHEIPLAARIVLVADAFDALTSDRPYRRGRGVDAAIAELRAHRGTQFCPEVIDALEELYREQPELLGSSELRAITAA